MFVKNNLNQFQCTKCDYVSGVQTNVINHIESKHVETPGVVCEVCHKQLKNRQSYRMHYHRDHGKDDTGIQQFGDV